MIVLDTDVLIEIFDKRSGKGDEALRKIHESSLIPQMKFGGLPSPHFYHGYGNQPTHNGSKEKKEYCGTETFGG